jgi:hypothetical protein
MKMNSLARKFTAAAIISALLTQACYAQAPPPSESQKAEMAKKKAEQKANEEAYRATIKRMPDSDQKVDPWGDMRAPAANGNK